MSLKTFAFDERRQVIVPGNYRETVLFATEHLLETAKKAIAERGLFTIALSGGSTPKAIFQELKKHKTSIDWGKVFVFWSDERAVSPDHPDSNYKMAMDNGLAELPIPKHQIFRMHAENHIETNAISYEELIKQIVNNEEFDFIMLGMGDDGHTASLFPGTKALGVNDKLVTSNYVDKQKAHRMTFTFPLIQKGLVKIIYVLGSEKTEVVSNVLYNEKEIYPAGIVGTKKHPALWILDNNAAASLVKKINVA
jgi:6-phosphogluconolactonase